MVVVGSSLALASDCMSDLSLTLQPTYTGEMQPNASSLWTNFALTFTNGSCYTASLNTYGQNGPLGNGAVRNVTGNSTVSGVTVGSAG